MENFHAIPYLQEIVIVLVTAGIVVPLFNRLHISPVLGYLLAGFAVGPHAFGSINFEGSILNYMTINHPERVALLAEFGIVFLLFMIGLELSPKRLWDMRKMVFGLGVAQVLLSTLTIGGIAYHFGNSPAASVILGACLALSSTAIVMQILMDRREQSTPMGRATFSILLFQDLAVVPLLIMLDLFSGAGGQGGVGMTVLLALGKAFGMVVALLVAGHYLLRPLFRIAGSAKGAEPFMAVTLLTVLLTATMTGMAGLSMALGAFLAGLLLAETEYRHAIEVYIEPFKGLLLGLFFMTVGMGIDPGLVKANLFWLVSSVFGLIFIKAAIITLSGRAFGLPWRVAAETGLLVGQGGEFAFVIIGAAMTLKLMPPETGQFMLIVAGLSMIVTPGVAFLSRRLSNLLRKREQEHLAMATPEDVPHLHGHIIVAGAGRVGLSMLRVLEAENIPYIALDGNMDVVSEKRALGHKVYYGDTSRYELLKHFHPESAQAIVLSIDDAHAIVAAISNIRRHWPDIPIFARARDKRVARLLHRAGATVVVAETVETSLRLSTKLLARIGLDADVVARRIEVEREMAIIGIKGV